MKRKIRILVVDDEESMRDSLSEWLREDGYEVESVESGEKAIEKIKKGKWTAALVDLKMPGIDGIETMREIRNIDKEIPVIIITAYATVDTAVRAMKEGAYDYIVKPFNPEEISMMLHKLVERQSLLLENIYLRKQLMKAYQFEDLIGKNKKMIEIFELIKTIADSKSTVLIQGETGTGKELIARAIHNSSLRKKGPFVTLSCAALPASILEAELFGYEKGAFTDAKATRRGKLEIAHGGTLFLDEIGDISPKTQVDLLRFLQEREFRRLGGEENIKVDVRVVAATNKNLKALVEQGKFREDLFYRLNVIKIDVPPLRERKEDISILVAHFLEKYNIENKKSVERVSEEGMELLLSYHWPGNVRELENCIERAVVICKGNLLKPSDFPEYIRVPVSPSYKEDMSLEELERIHIEKILTKYKYNIQKSSEVLGIDRVTLYRKMKKYNIKMLKTAT
ncbi:MAG: sigma-54-dependent transcriptional regulator [Candidatus Aminicenantia bacterium]